jgi:hypothetical protein
MQVVKAGRAALHKGTVVIQMPHVVPDVNQDTVNAKVMQVGDGGLKGMMMVLAGVVLVSLLPIDYPP